MCMPVSPPPLLMAWMEDISLCFANQDLSFQHLQSGRHSNLHSLCSAGRYTPLPGRCLLNYSRLETQAAECPLLSGSENEETHIWRTRPHNTNRPQAYRFHPARPCAASSRQTSCELWQRHCTRLTEDVPTLSNEPSVSFILPKAQPPSSLTSMELNHHIDTSLRFCFFQLLFCPKQMIFLIFPYKDHKDQSIQLGPVHTKPVTYGLIFRVSVFLLPIRKDDK